MAVHGGGHLHRVGAVGRPVLGQAGEHLSSGGIEGQHRCKPRTYAINWRILRAALGDVCPLGQLYRVAVSYTHLGIGHELHLHL